MSPFCTGGELPPCPPAVGIASPGFAGETLALGSTRRRAQAVKWSGRDRARGRLEKVPHQSSLSVQNQRLCTAGQYPAAMHFEKVPTDLLAGCNRPLPCAPQTT